MARYTGPKEKISRRAGSNLFLKGERSYGPKNAFVRRPYPPGQHGSDRKRQVKLSDFGKQLREKQKAKAIYGILEKQFRNYYLKASKTRGATGVRLLQLLELRLDNVIFRLGLANSRSQARQYVTHGHVLVDGKKTNIPSYQVKPKQKVALKKIKIKPVSGELPLWLERDKKELAGQVLAVPTREQIPVDINEQLIVEYYSR